jgi:hypothetical protein
MVGAREQQAVDAAGRGRADDVVEELFLTVQVV